MLVVLISYLYLCICQPRGGVEPIECQFTQKCIEESALLATNEIAREYRPYCEGISILLFIYVGIILLQFYFK